MCKATFGSTELKIFKSTHQHYCFYCTVRLREERLSHCFPYTGILRCTLSLCVFCIKRRNKHKTFDIKYIALFIGYSTSIRSTKIRENAKPVRCAPHIKRAICVVDRRRHTPQYCQLAHFYAFSMLC